MAVAVLYSLVGCISNLVACSTPEGGSSVYSLRGEALGTVAFLDRVCSWWCAEGAEQGIYALDAEVWTRPVPEHVGSGGRAPYCRAELVLVWGCWFLLAA